MSDRSWRDRIGAAVLTLQIIVAALFSGCLTFLVIAWFIGQQAAQRPGGQDQTLLTMMALVFAGIILVVRAIVPRMMVRQGRGAILRGQSPDGRSPGPPYAAEADEGTKLMALFQTKTIVGAALLEGATFFLLIVYIVEHSPLAPLAAMAMMAGILLHMPTRSGMTHWIEDQLRQLEQERQLAGR